MASRCVLDPRWTEKAEGPPHLGGPFHMLIRWLFRSRPMVYWNTMGTGDAME